MIKNNEFSKLFPRGTKLPPIDAIRDTLMVMDIDGLKQVNQIVVKTGVRIKFSTMELLTEIPWSQLMARSSSVVVRKAVQNA
jgi:hypothetical protein